MRDVLVVRVYIAQFLQAKIGYFVAIHREPFFVVRGKRGKNVANNFSRWIHHIRARVGQSGVHFGGWSGGAVRQSVSSHAQGGSNSNA